MVEFDFAEIEKKWQKKWEEGKIFETKENSKKPKYYVLEMFPYPSASGLHMGHALNYSIGDVMARFKRMNGFEVLYPMGFDALGLPAENAAIKAGSHPKPFTENAISNYIRQMKELGLSYDWSKTLATMYPEYYRWNQYFFLKFLEAGFIYRKKAPVNWCPSCNTVISNEQAQGGICERCKSKIEIKHLDEWYLKTTKYADELLDGLDGLDWPEKIKAMQKNWIGKSHGVEIDFEIEGKEKVILVDAVNAFVIKGKGINNEMYDILEKFSNKKIVLTGANNEEYKKFNLKDVPYEIFTLKHEPDKSSPEYYRKMLENFGLSSEDVIYFEHNADAIKSAESAGIKTFHYDKDKKDLVSLKKFIDENLAKKWPIFTTRPDTIFGVTFMVVSAQHERLNELVTKEQRKDVDKFLKNLGSVSEKEMIDLEKEGVFTGSYAINPANGEKIPIYVGNFVVADYGSGMVMAVPAHDQRDFEFAKKYGIETKQVIAPFFGIKEGPDAIREDKKTVERESVFGIVKHWKNDEYYCLDWKKFGWKSLIIGGVEEGESYEEAVIREVKEETGYQDIKLVKQVSVETHANFFARHKDINRYGKFKTFLVELKSDKWIKPEEEHVKNHDGEWIQKKDVENYLNLENNSYVWNDFIHKECAYTDSGILVNSGKFDRLDNIEAKEKITNWLAKKNVARKVVNYKLRDWGFSRQRYWGTPIPIIHCEKCGIVPVPEKDLPVVLPEDVKFGKGNPLTTNKKWISVKCPKCGGEGKRETETMDTFFDSSWYFLRYPDNKNDKEPFSKKNIKKWLPVDQYIGGAEHACMHLIYARFFTKVLRDLKFLDFDEPFKALFNQGMLQGSDGDKMSKSKGNIINPDEISNKYGMDTARYFLLSLAAPDKPRDWSEKGIQGSLRFVKKIFGISENIKFGKSSNEFVLKLNFTIKDVGEFYGSFKYRKATIKLKELFDLLAEQCEVAKKDFGDCLKLLSPICPHISEELWGKFGNKDFISNSEWPKVDKSKLKKKIRATDLNDKIIEDVKIILEKAGDKSKKAYIYVMPFEIGKVDVRKIGKGIGKKVEVFAVSDSKKYDPVGKAKKARPGKASIYLE